MGTWFHETIIAKNRLALFLCFAAFVVTFIVTRVITRNIHPSGHTRLPRYARARRGVIERVHGAHVFPDSNAQGRGEAPQWLYAVVFTGTELWGDEADETVTASIDAWESYLEPL